MTRFATITDCVPEPCRIIGTWLRPFCLGHHLLFRRLGVPFAEDAKAEFDRDQLVTGIAICAGDSYESTLDAFLDGQWPDIIGQWKRDVLGPWWRRNRIDWQDAELTFRAYLADGYALPPRMRRLEAGGVRLTAPWELTLKIVLLKAGLSETEIMNGYLPARWYESYVVQEQAQLDLLERLAIAGDKRPERAWRRVFTTEEIANLSS